MTGQLKFSGGIVRLLEIAMEGLVLAMVCLSPWALGSVGEEFEFYLFAAVAVLLVMWGLKMLVQWRVSWKTCPVAMCLAAMILLGVFQLKPLSKSSIRWVSPATASLYDRLLPAQPEVLPRGEARESLAVPAGSTLSLYPDATRKSLIHLLAIFSLFVVVRNNVASIGALRRLSVAILVNGAALSLFGLIQFFSNSESGTIYWMFPSSGSAFGPFVNRNHFAYYINPCIGLTLGLLLERGRTPSDLLSVSHVSVLGRLRYALRDQLGDPTALWIGMGMALMLSSIVFCLSRGGFLALVGSTTLCSMLLVVRGSGNWRICAVLLSVAVAVSLLIWFGLESVETRLSTLWTGEAVGDARVFLLSHAWPLIREFPIWGTGYGTFEYIEPLQLHTAGDVGSIYEHAHNDYLEDSIEGGSIRLLIRLIAIGLIFRFGYKALRTKAGTSLAAIALGSVFAFTTIVIHSFFEFGLYVPAIAVLATVLCANLCGVGDAASTERESEESEPNHSAKGGRDGQLVGLGRAMPLLGAVFASLLGWFLYSEGSKAATIDGLRSEARGLRRAAYEGTLDRAAEIPLLQASVSLDPNDAERRFMLSEAHFDVYKQQIELAQPDTKQMDVEAKRHLTAAMRHVLCARDLCPLLPAPHTRIAFYVDALASAEPRSAYIDRAKFLAPVDPQLWYLCGLQELADNQPQKAWKSWRRSLELSDRFLTRILDRAATVLSPDEMLTIILPDQPAILLAAAHYLYPEPKATLQRQPLLNKALTLCENQPGPLDSEAWYIKASLYRQLEQPTKAIAAYQSALVYDPRQEQWRFELATLLHDQGQRQESRRELGILLSRNPNHAEAQKLLEVLAREIAEGKI